MFTYLLTDITVASFNDSQGVRVSSQKALKWLCMSLKNHLKPHFRQTQPKGLSKYKLFKAFIMEK